MKKISFARRFAAVLVAGAVALSGGVAAFAAGESVDFDATKKGSITVHKHFGDPVGDGNGKETTVSNEPLSGVKFKIEKVNEVDLSTNAGWKKAEEIQLGNAIPSFTPVGTDKTTDSRGIVEFTGLDVGLYRVTETDASQAKKNGQGEVVNVKMAAPFYVSVPLTDPDNRSKWIYDIHVYPKNQSFTVIKTSQVIAGDQMRYTVVASLPKLGGDKKYEKYTLIDKLSDNHDPSSFTIEKIEAITGADDKDPTGIDKTLVTIDNSKASQNLIYVRFNHPAGLAKLDEVSAAGKKEIRYTYTVKIKDSFKQGELNNTAYVAPSTEYSDEPGDNTPNGGNTKKFVQFKIEKQDSSNHSKKLAGAKFELYACNSEGKFIDATGAVVKEKAKALKLSGDNPIVTNEQGQTGPIRIPVADSNEKDIKKICAVETEAPSGYTLLTEPVTFEVSYQEGTEANPIMQTIDNVKDNAGWKLPMTGASGLILLSIAGVLLITGSILIPVVHRRSKKSVK